MRVGKRNGQDWEWVGKSVKVELREGGQSRRQGRSRVDPSLSHLFSFPYHPFGPNRFVRPPRDKADLLHTSTRQERIRKCSPDGRRWKSNFFFDSPFPTTIVCPALFPPAHLAQISASLARISTSFPFPSSPHWDPRTTVTPGLAEREEGGKGARLALELSASEAVRFYSEQTTSVGSTVCTYLMSP